MSKLWKDFRTNLLYWRFRNITRNRLRLQNWWNTRRPGARRISRPPAGYAPYRARGTAMYYTGGRSSRQTWIILMVMVALLTALTVAANSVVIFPGLVTAIGALIVVGAIYLAMRGI